MPLSIRSVTTLRECLRLGADELQALMPAHHERMTRLMEMHRTMMAGMEH